MASGGEESGLRTPPVFFVDRTFGGIIVAREPRLAGLQAVAHDEHERFKDPQGSYPDSEWMKLVRDMGWIAITEDRDIAKNRAQLANVKRYHVPLFVQKSANLRAAQAAQLFIAAYPKIIRFIAEHPPPFVAGVYRVLRKGGRVGARVREIQTWEKSS